MPALIGSTPTQSLAIGKPFASVKAGIAFIAYPGTFQGYPVPVVLRFQAPSDR